VTRAAIVTGGGTGIGRATALALRRDGFSVVIGGRRSEPLEAVRDQIGAEHCAIQPGDIRKPEVADALIDLALERFGRVDALVNNAGGQFVAPAEDITANGWEAVRRLNLDAPWYLTQQVAKRWMIPQGGGRVVSVVLCPTRGIPFMAHSSAARAGMSALTNTLSVEWGKHNIALTCVAPGWIDTEGIQQYDADLDLVASGIPMLRLGRPEEVADLIAFLVSDRGGYITGQTIVIDGGMENVIGSTPARVD
jgi:citronellol/citronellal dehydrogenase